MPDRPNKRTVRVPLVLKVEVKTGFSTFFAQGRDLSNSGMGIYHHKLPPLGSSVEVRFKLPDSMHQVDATAEVTHVEHGREGPAQTWMGIKFVRLDADSHDAIGKYVQITKDLGQGNVPGPPPLPKKNNR